MDFLWAFWAEVYKEREAEPGIGDGPDDGEDEADDWSRGSSDRGVRSVEGVSPLDAVHPSKGRQFAAEVAAQMNK